MRQFINRVHRVREFRYYLYFLSPLPLPVDPVLLPLPVGPVLLPLALPASPLVPLGPLVPLVPLDPPVLPLQYIAFPISMAEVFSVSIDSLIFCTSFI